MNDTNDSAPKSGVPQETLSVIRSLLYLPATKGVANHLDEEDLSINKAYIQKWLRRYPGKEKEFPYDIIHTLVSDEHLITFEDIRTYYLAQPGADNHIVTLDEAKTAKPYRRWGLEVNFVKDIDFHTFQDSVADAYNVLSSSMTLIPGRRGAVKLSQEEKIIEAHKRFQRAYNTYTNDDSVLTVSEKGEEDIDRVMDGVNETGMSFPFPTVADKQPVFEKTLNIIAAPAGGYKSRTLMYMAALNIAKGFNVAIVPLEMDKDEIEAMIVTFLISMSEIWEKTPYYAASKAINLKDMTPDEIRRLPLYKEVKRKLLSPHAEEEDPWGELILLDCAANDNLVTLTAKLEAKDLDLRTRKGEKHIIHLVCLDYLALIPVPASEKIQGEEQRINWLMANCKIRMCMNFCGRGVVVASAHQINREGQKRTDKLVGSTFFKPYDLAGSGAVERYADLCLAIKVISRARAHVGTLKVRRKEAIDPYEVSINWRYGRLDEYMVDDIQGALMLFEMDPEMTTNNVQGV